MGKHSAVLRLHCSVPEAAKAVDDAIKRMKLKVRASSTSDEGFRRSAKQKTQWTSTSWPMSVEIVGTPKGAGTLVEFDAHAGESVASAVHDAGHIERNINQLVSMVKEYAPHKPDPSASTSSPDLAAQLKQLTDLHAAGALSAGEFENAKARLLES